MSRTRPTLTVDHACEGDLPALAAILYSAREPAAQAEADRASSAAPRDLAAQVRGQDRWEVLVGRLHGRAVAFLAMRLLRDQGRGELDQLAVHPGERGHGIGAALLDTALTRMHLEGLSEATTRAPHEPALRALYVRAGFDDAQHAEPGAFLTRRLVP